MVRWVSTLVGGINQITPKKVIFEDLLSITEGTANIISCCFEDRRQPAPGVLGKGLGVCRGQGREGRSGPWKENGGISQEDIFDVQQDHNGDYWMASRNDGLIYLKHQDLCHPRFQVFSTANSGIGSNVVMSLELTKTVGGFGLHQSFARVSDVDRNLSSGFPCRWMGCIPSTFVACTMTVGTACGRADTA